MKLILSNGRELEILSINGTSIAFACEGKDEVIDLWNALTTENLTKAKIKDEGKKDRELIGATVSGFDLRWIDDHMYITFKLQSGEIVQVAELTDEDKSAVEAAREIFGKADITNATEVREVVKDACSMFISDDKALKMPYLLPVWTEESMAYKKDQRVIYQDILYKVLQDHTSQADWSPAAASSLFAKILPGQEGAEVGAWVQPDSTNAYKKGERVTYKGKTYESVIDGNVWAPDAYPAGWKEV